MIRQTAARFARFLVTGGIAAIVDISVFSLLYGQGMPGLWAAAGSFLAAATVSYVLASIVIYSRRPGLQMLARFLAAYLLGLGINVSVTMLGLGWLGLPPALAKAGGIGVACIFNFAVMNFVLFSEGGLAGLRSRLSPAGRWPR